MASFIARGLRRTYLYAGSHLPFAGIKGTNFISLVIFPFSELALSYSVLVYNAINELTSIVNSMLYILHHILLVSFILYASRFLVLGPWHQRLHNDFQFSSGLWSTGCQSSNGLSTKQDAFSSNNSQTQSYSDSLIIIMFTASASFHTTFGWLGRSPWRRKWRVPQVRSLVFSSNCLLHISTPIYDTHTQYLFCFLSSPSHLSLQNTGFPKKCLTFLTSPTVSQSSWYLSTWPIW